MVGDEAFRQCVSALWALVGAMRDAKGEPVDAPLSVAFEAVRVARGDDSYLLIHEVAGALHVSGRMLRLGVDIFAAANGLASLLREREIGEVLFDDSVDLEALDSWVRSHALGAPAVDVDRAYRGIHTSRRVHDEAAVPLVRSAPIAEAPDSRLRFVFLQHHLIEVFGPSSAVPPQAAKLAIGAVVERMLEIDGGMEALTLLQRDEPVLRRSLHVAVLAVVVARVIGWPEERLVDLGCAALLHDVGQLIDASQPGLAAFAWLLERGAQEFWLQSAIVARSWRSDHGRALSDVGPDGCLAAAIVRLAVTVVGHDDATAGPLLSTRQVLHGSSERGEFPLELADVALRTLCRYS